MYAPDPRDARAMGARREITVGEGHVYVPNLHSVGKLMFRTGAQARRETYALARIREGYVQGTSTLEDVDALIEGVLSDDWLLDVLAPADVVEVVYADGQREEISTW